MGSRRSWHGFTPGQAVALAEVVATCRKRIRDGKVIRAEEKLKATQDMEASGYAEIVYSPRRTAGWGASPLNVNNWKTPRGDSIV